jgi:hypothetical protein
MGLTYKVFLDDVLVEEPIGMDSLELSIVRDDQNHGIGLESTTSPLQFYGDGAAYLESVKTAQGLKAKVVFKLQTLCGDDDGIYQDVLVGKVNMGTYHKACGNECTISVAIESVTCETILNNQYDQQIDVDKGVGFDGVTVLNPYNFLGENIELPTRQLDYRTEGTVVDAGDVEPIEFPASHHGDAVIWVRPEYGNNPNNNIKQSHLVQGENVGYIVLADAPGKSPIVSSQVLFDEANIQCFTSPITVTGRLKGRLTLIGSHASAKILMIRGDIADINTLDIIESTDLINPGIDNPNVTFDHTFPVYSWTPVASGTDNIFHLIQIIVDESSVPNGQVSFDKESFFSAVGIKGCPPTETKGYLIHETLSRMTEAITNSCCRVKSTYYGRKDSEPFAFDTDGCGGLRFVTSGLKIRNAPNATFFASLKELIEGLQAIDNIGMGLETDPDIEGNILCRVESLDYFYQDKEIMNCGAIPVVEATIEEARAYNTVNIGYKKWKTLNNFGLDEFNSDRQYRTPLDSIKTQLDITSGLVAGEYAIEITREQQFDDTNAADTSYDDDTFIVLLTRNSSGYGYPYGQMIVEQGNVSAPENIFSPTSVLNYGISPVRNLFRWFRSIAASFPNIVDSDNRLSFNSGTGNILAKGELAAIYGGSCRLENLPIQENQNLAPTQFADPLDATPLWRNESVEFDYPMALGDYKKIKLNPYGYISYQCGSADFEKGWIKEIKYQPNLGTAHIVLRKKWTV